MDVADLQRLKESNEACKIALELHDRVAELERKLKFAVEGLLFYAKGDHLEWVGSSPEYMTPRCDLPKWLPNSCISAVEWGGTARKALEEIK